MLLPILFFAVLPAVVGVGAFIATGAVLNGLFWSFATVTVSAALAVISVRNPVHAALFLVLSFFSTAAIWLLLKAEFLAIVLILVYVGAVMVLFLFVVMMLDINFDKLREGFRRYMPLGLLVGAVMVAQMGILLTRSFPVTTAQAIGPVPGTNNTRELGKIMYSDYVFHVQVAAVILFVALIAAVALTLRRRKDVRYNDPAGAVRTRASDRVRVVNVPAVKSAAQDPTSEQAS